ncbi:MAG: hypothetical protein WDM70_00620 [Nitrosomonadales bacterium]
MNGIGMDVIVPKPKDPPPELGEGRIDLLVAYYITLDLGNPELFVGLDRHLCGLPIPACQKEESQKMAIFAQTTTKSGLPISCLYCFR